MQRQRMRAFWWAVAGGFLLALVALRVAQRWNAWQQAEAHRQAVATRYAAMVETGTALAQEATAVASPDFVEERARIEGKMARKGEVLVRPVPVPGAPPVEAGGQPTPTPTPTPTPAPWQVWWALFFAKP